MREVLFRAKRIDNKEWAEGYYGIKAKGTDMERHYIMVSTYNAKLSSYPFYLTDIQIDPETLCQYTGLKDKNGNQIWENDIIRVKNSADEGTGKVEFYGGMWYVDKGVNNSLYDIMMYDDEAEVYTVGNIFDTPELLKEQ